MSPSVTSWNKKFMAYDVTKIEQKNSAYRQFFNDVIEMIDDEIWSKSTF